MAKNNNFNQIKELANEDGNVVTNQKDLLKDFGHRTSFDILKRHSILT